MYLASHTTRLATAVAGAACLIFALFSLPSVADDEADNRVPSMQDEQVAWAESANEENDAGELPTGVSEEQHRAQVAVDTFLQPLIADLGLDLWASVDWSAKKIELSGSPGVMTKLSKFDGMSVAELRVQVSQASVTRHEYEESIRRLSAAASKISVTIEAYSLPATSDFIEIHVRNLDEIKPTTVDQAQHQIQLLIDLPFRLSSASPDRWTDRGDSAAPWRGGVQMRHNIGTAGMGCSTAFPVVKNGIGYVLSAAHCDQTTSAPRWSWRDWANNSWISYSSGFVGKTAKKTLDSLLLNPHGGTEGRIYSGKWNQSPGTSRYLMKVNGASSTYLGSRVCTNGANSGQHCQLTVFTNDDVPCASQGICHRWVAFNNKATGVAAASTDSGGGVYFDLGNDRVGARGVISQARGRVVTCGNTRLSGATCSNGVLFVGIVDVLQKWGVSIEKS